MTDDRDSWREQADARTADALRFANELTTLKASMPDIEAVMRLADVMAAWKEVACSNPTPGSTKCYEAARKALRKALGKPDPIRQQAQALITARDNFGWSSDTDAAIEALRRSFTVGAGVVARGGHERHLRRHELNLERQAAPR
jgi:hypothetical protein